MKILYYFKNLNNAMYQWQRHHIFDELKYHGIEISVFSPLDYANYEEAQDALIKHLHSHRYDLFMTPMKDEEIHSSTIDYIRSLGIPTLLICFDNLTVPFNHKKISSHFDLVWLTSIETDYLFKRWNATTIFLPYAANPHIITPKYDKDNESVLFIGTPYGSRCKMINNLIDNDVNVSLFGLDKQSESGRIIPNVSKKSLAIEIKRMLSFPIGRKLAYASIKNKFLKQSVLHADSEFLTKFPPVDLKTMMHYYNNYALSLSSVTNRHTGVLKHPVMIANLRSFEIPASGGILFCQFNPELNQHFIDGKEAIYYHNDADMIDKAKFYLSQKNRNIRLAIKQAARLKAENEETWFTRFSKIFEKLNISV